MKQKRHLLVTGLGIIFLLVSLSCQFSLPEMNTDSKDEVVEVKSPDGSAVMTLSRGNLPKGVKETDLSIELIANSEPQESKGPEWIYELSPDGISFDQPVELIFHLTYDRPIFSVGLIQYSETGESEALDISEIDFLDGETVQIKTEITHFSKIQLHSRFFNVIHFEYPDQAIPVGTPFDIEFELFRRGQVVDSHWGENTWRGEMLGGGSWYIIGDWFAGASFSPNEILSQSSGVQEVDKYKITSTWKCNKPSELNEEDDMIPESIYYSGRIFYRAKVTKLDENYNDMNPSLTEYGLNREDVTEHLIAIASPIYCLGEAPTSTPELPPTAGPETTVFKDDIDDPICCEKCQDTTGDLPKKIDIETVSYKLLKGELNGKESCFHRITVKTVKPLNKSYGRVSISIYDPDLPQALGKSPSCFEAGLNRTYSIESINDKSVSTQGGVEVNEAGIVSSWKDDYITTGFTFTIDQNGFHFYIPCDQLSADATWMAWTTDDKMCDEVGYR